MEERLKEILDSLNIEETSKLLDKDIKIKLDKGTEKRIKTSLYKKLGISIKRKIYKKLVAAAVIILAIGIISFKFDIVSYAFSSLFRFIPGYGIVDSNTDIKYALQDSDLSSQDKDYKITLTNAVATKNTIKLVLVIERKNFKEEDIIAIKKAPEEKLKKTGILLQPKISLVAFNKEFPSSNVSIGSGGASDLINIGFDLKPEYIKEDTQYVVNYKDYNLKLSFTLKSLDKAAQVENIDTSNSHNNISITAASYEKDNKLEVDLYPINKSRYKIVSYTKYNKGYMGENLSLEAEEETFSYTEPNSFAPPNNRFTFSTQKTEGLTLKIPYITVESEESKNVTLKIPSYNEILTINKKVAFKDSTMIISQVERVKEAGSKYGALKLSLKYENKNKNRIMISAQFNRLNMLNMTGSGGYSAHVGDNDQVNEVYYSLDKGENSSLRLKVSNPNYYFIGEYSLKIK